MSASQPKVLVVDTDETGLELLATVLTRQGYDVTATPDSCDAVSRFLDDGADLILCTDRVQPISAIQLCREIRSREARVRLVMVLSLASEEDEAAVRERTGCDGVLVQPFRYDALSVLLEQWSLLPERSTPEDAADPPVCFSVPIPEPMAFEVAAPQPLQDSDEPNVGTEGESAHDSSPAALTPMFVPITVPPPADGSELASLAQLEAAADLAVEEAVAVMPVGVEQAEVAPTPQVAPALRPTPIAGGLPANVPRYGDLKSLPVPRLIFELYLATFTGKARLTRKGLSRTIYFWGGLPASVDSDQLHENLGHVLLEHGRISQQQYESAMAVVEARGCPQGDAMVEVGCISRADLLDALKEQAELKVVNTFAWRDGAYEIEPNTSFAEQLVLSEIHPVKAIWRGVAEHYDLCSLMAFFGPLIKRYIAATDLFEVQCGAVAPLLRELGLRRFLDGRTTFEEAIRSDDTKALSIVQALYVLLVTEMIRPQSKPGSGVSTEAKQPTRRKSATVVDYRIITRVCDDIAAEYLRLKEASVAAQALGLVADPPAAAEIEAIYQRRMAAYSAERLPAGLPDDVMRRAAEIGTMLTRARAALLHADQDETSLDETKEPSGPKPEDASQEDHVVMAARRQRVEAERHFAAGVKHLAAQDVASARAEFTQAIALNDSEPTYRVAMGRTVLAEENCGPDAAAVHFQQALQLDPGHVEANFELGKLLAATGAPEMARTYLERVLQRTGEHPEARKLLAEIS